MICDNEGEHTCVMADECADEIAVLKSRILEMEAQQREDWANINRKADFIDATLNDMAAQDEQLAAAEAIVKMVREFIDTQDISCAETIYQSDRVIENAYEFIEKLCDLVGYKKYEDDE